MSHAWQKYIMDARMKCKYGSNCYQQNRAHNKIFKHPPRTLTERDLSIEPKIEDIQNLQLPTVPETEIQISRASASSSTRTDIALSNLQLPTVPETEIQISRASASSSTRTDIALSNLQLPTVPETEIQISRASASSSTRTDIALSNLQLPTVPGSKIPIRRATASSSTRTDIALSNPDTNNKLVATKNPQHPTVPKIPINDRTYVISRDKQGPIVNSSTSVTDIVQSYQDKSNESVATDIKFHHYNDKSLLKELFLVDMPEDFYDFYTFLEKTFMNIDASLKNVNLEIIGPYELLMGRLPIFKRREMYLINWRYYYDTPEFQTVLKYKGASEYHIGYFRDTPTEAPCFLASNDSSKNCVLKPISNNIFGAVYIFLQNEMIKSPFTTTACKIFMRKISQWNKNKNYDLTAYNIKKRHGMIVTETLHSAGIAVPYNKSTQIGYRKLVNYDALKQMFKDIESATTKEEKDAALSELQVLITNTDIAMDECDFGTGLEMGINLFCSGIKELEGPALNYLRSSYQLLNRKPFVDIATAHHEFRRKGPQMSALEINK